MKFVMKKPTLIKKRKYNAPVIEGLEPRILLSADLPGLDLSAGDLDLPDYMSTEDILRDAQAEFDYIDAQDTAINDHNQDSNQDVQDDHSQLLIESRSQATDIRHELVIIDADVEDYAQLVESIQSQTDDDVTLEVIILDSNRNGIEQISEILADQQNLDALHLISHGSSGSVQVGNSQLSQSELTQHSQTISQWGNAFSAEGDWLIYGCDLAADAQGEQFINTLATLTATDVAASDDATGHADLGGDWELEYQSGTIETDVVFDVDTQQEWGYLLAESDSSTNHAPTDLSSGIELNTDGGNDAYLYYSEAGGTILGGLEQITVEVAFSLDADAESTADIGLISYVTSSFNDELQIVLDSDGQLELKVQNESAATTDSIPELYDGQLHYIAASWDNTNGDVQLYVDGQLVQTFSDIAKDISLNTAGTLVLGQDQDSEGNFESDQSFHGTFYDVRIWNEVRSEAEVSLNYQNKFDSSNLPTGLVANWQMNAFNDSNEVVDAVSGKNLTIGHAAGDDFTTSNPVDDLHISEDAEDGATVGYVVTHDPDVYNDLISDGLFLEAGIPDNYATYGLGDTFGSWQVVQNSVDLLGYSEEGYSTESPLGGLSVDLNGNAPGAIEQTLTTEIGSTYQVTFALSGNWTSGEDVKDLSASTGDTSINFSITKPDDWSVTNILWEHRTFTFVAASTSTTLQFKSLEESLDSDSNNNSGPVIGDVQVIERPAAVDIILTNDSTLTYDAASGKFSKEVETASLVTESTLLNGVSGDSSGDEDSGYIIEWDASEVLSNFTFTLTDTSNNFEIDGSTGEIKVAATNTLDYESNTSHNLVVQVTDAADNSYTENMTISVNDANDAPVITSATTATAIDENSGAGQVVYTATATDVDSDTITYSLSGTDAEKFNIDGSSGEVTLTADPDFETQASYNFTVIATDNGTDNLNDIQAVTLTINDLTTKVVDDAFTLYAGVPVTIDPISNDIDALTITEIIDTANGDAKTVLTKSGDKATLATGTVIELRDDGRLKVTAASAGDDSFDYVVTDSNGNSDTGTVELMVGDDQTTAEKIGFVTTWKTDNAGTSDDNQISIPIGTKGSGDVTVNFTVYWGDGTSNTYNSIDELTEDKIEHTYTDAFTYTVSIVGDFPGINFDGKGDADKLLTIEQWGNIAWQDLDDAFEGADNLVINATDAPDLSAITDLSDMFKSAISFNSNIGNWDTSSIKNMTNMFQGTQFNQDIGDWDTSSVTTMHGMFAQATAFNQDIGAWDTSNVTSMKSTFWSANAFNQNIGGWDTSSVKDMQNMFRSNSTFNQDIAAWDTSSITTMGNMFWGASAFDQDIGSWEINNVNNMGNMLSSSGLSIENYDATLTGWAAQAVKSDITGITLGASGLYYNTSATERDYLVDDNSWTINDEGPVKLKLDLDADDSSAATVSDFATTWIEDGDAVLIADNDATIIDNRSIDSSSNLKSITITLTNLLDINSETLTADTAGTSITASYDSTTGVLTLSDSDSLANYQQVLRTVTYDNNSQSPDESERVITFEVSDGTYTSNLASTTVKVVAVNDAATVSSESKEINEIDSAITTSGQLTASDVDNEDNIFKASTLVGSNGTFNIDKSGTWTFTANDAFDQLNENEKISETFNVASIDGTASSVIIQINGTNDAATVSSESQEINEIDSAITTSGQLTASDVDNEDNVFKASTLVGSNGTFNIDKSGTWTFTANDAFDQLNENEKISETFNVASIDGTASSVIIQINGTNDAAVVSSQRLEVDETDAPITTAGQLTASDVDNEENTFTSNTTVGKYGTFTINASGKWTFTAESAFNQLIEGEHYAETFNVSSIDGTISTVTIQINGTRETDTSVAENERIDEPELLEPTPTLDEKTDLPEDIVDNNIATEAVKNVDLTIDILGEQGQFMTTPLDEDIFLSVLSERPVSNDDNDNTSLVEDQSQTFLQELTSIWVDNGIQTETITPLSTTIADIGSRSPEFLDDLDKMQQDLDASAEQNQIIQNLNVETVAGVGITGAAIFVSWLLRGGSLLASLLTAMPAWRSLDVLPILTASEALTPAESSDPDVVGGDAAGANIDALFEDQNLVQSPDDRIKK